MDGETKPPILDLFHVECKDDIQMTKTSLKKCTYVLETPSIIGQDVNKGQRRAFVKEICEYPKMSEADLRTLTTKDESGNLQCDYMVQDGRKSLNSICSSQDKLHHWVDTYENGLQNTVIDRKAESGKDKSRMGHSCERNFVELRQEERDKTCSEMNDCLFRCRVKDRDSAQEIRGKVETLRVYLEEKIGAESSVACLDLVKKASGRKVCPVPNESVLRTIEGVLGKDGMTYVPVVLYLHNLEQSCEWLSEWWRHCE